jgi:YYY domain-containing protein
MAFGRITLLALWTLLMFWAGHVGWPVWRGGWLLLPFLLISTFMWWRDRAILVALLRDKRRGILVSESTFLLVFLLFFLLRGFWPDINNGEKPMDMALIAACARAERLPPANPYLAGSQLGGYYYLGHLETALLSNTIGAQARWTYNLMCATLPALCFSALFSLCAALSGHLWRGLSAAVLVLTLGTWEPWRQWFAPPDGVATRPFGPRLLDYFSTSRVIPNPINPDAPFAYTINEYPWFSFHYADLHAHYFAMPLAIVVMALGVALYQAREIRPAPFILGGLLLGALLMTNAWDAPTYLLLLGLCLLPSKYFETPLEHLEKSVSGTFPKSWLLALVSIALVSLVMLLAAWPYLIRLHTNAYRPTPLDQPASPLRDWLLMWGVFVTAWIINLALPSLRRTWEDRTVLRTTWWLSLPVGTWLVLRFSQGTWVWHWPRPGPNANHVILSLGRDYSVLLLVTGVALWTAFSAFHSVDARHRLLCRFALCGLLALLWSETTWAGFIEMQRTGTTFHRQDTVFKFGLQTWYLLGIATACAALRVSDDTGAITTPSKYFRGWNRPLLAMFSLLLLVPWCASAVTMVARARNFVAFRSWDAWSHLRAPEREAAQWLQEQARVGDNLMEAQKLRRSDYSPFTRYAHVTGIPAVVGPTSHTFQWGQGRKGEDAMWKEVWTRKRDVRTFYISGEAAVRQGIARHYGVRFVICGELERAEYGWATIDALERSWPRQQRFGRPDDPHRVTILQVVL